MGTRRHRGANVRPGDRAAAQASQHRGWDPGRLPAWVPGGLPHVKVGTRFTISLVVGLLWAAVSAVLARPWIEDLAASISWPAAIVLVAGIAIIPGYLNAQLLVALAFDRPRPLGLMPVRHPDLALLIAAFDEERIIRATLDHAREQDYPGRLEIVVIDDGSTDRTAEIVAEVARTDPRVRLLRCDHGGKANALNAGLAEVRTHLVASVDADTLLTPQALRRAAERLLLSPPDTVAVAGAVMARNQRANLLTRMQDWDYLLGIASVKRQQSLVRGTLVAQGAFSVFRADVLRAVGGWPDRIGEDIVLTWSILEHGDRVTYEATAVAFTDVPTSLGAFVRQRNRWARGMIEGLRRHGRALLAQHRLTSYAVGVNWGFPYLDVVFTFAWLPGLALALTGNFVIVGPMALAVLPLNVLMSAVMYTRQHAAMAEVGLVPRRNWSGLLAYLLGYQLLMSPVSVVGYVQELAGTRRRW